MTLNFECGKNKQLEFSRVAFAGETVAYNGTDDERMLWSLMPKRITMSKDDFLAKLAALNSTSVDGEELEKILERMVQKQWLNCYICTLQVTYTLGVKKLAPETGDAQTSSATLPLELYFARTIRASRTRSVTKQQLINDIPR